MTALVLLTALQTYDIGITFGYWIGIMLALLILAYLIYTLIKPEKF